MLRLLERLFNAINDKDINWYGFVHMRPAKSADMSPAVVVKLSLFFAPLTALTAFLIVRLMFRASGVDRDLAESGMVLPVCIGAGCAAAGLFVVGQLTSAHFWNRRAERLRNAQGTPETADETMKDSYRELS
jgi:hypothetical protein